MTLPADCLWNGRCLVHDDTAIAAGHAAGRAAYEAFCERMLPWAPPPLKTFPAWEEQPENIQSAWISAAAAARGV